MKVVYKDRGKVNRSKGKTLLVVFVVFVVEPSNLSLAILEICKWCLIKFSYSFFKLDDNNQIFLKTPTNSALPKVFDHLE